MNINYKSVSKLVFAVAVAVYFFIYAIDPETNIIVNNSLLAFHEAGHIIFLFFGKVVGVMGGTLFQLLIPIAFVLYFCLKGAFYSAGIMGIFLGASLINVSVYVQDANIMNLELLNGGIHDWNYLLSKVGFLEYALNIGSLVYWSGLIIIIFSLLVSMYYSLNTDENAGGRVLNILE